MKKHACNLCPHNCELLEGEQAICMARSATDQGVILHAYGKITNINVEPIEKKPLYHFYPGMRTISVGGFGCNFNCDYCQNYLVSQRNRAETSKDISPEWIAEEAISRGCGGVCFTYNEPIIYFEYIRDLAAYCKEQNLKFILKTNAFCNPVPWQEICSFTDAMNIDWKGTEKRYNDVAQVSGESIVRERIAEAYERGVHLEISIPVYFGSDRSEYIDFFDFISNLNPQIPIHLLKIFPCNRTSHVSVTSDILLHRCYDDAKKRLHYPYVHGIHDWNNNTICHVCNKIIVERKGLKVFSHNNSCECNFVKSFT